MCQIYTECQKENSHFHCEDVDCASKINTPYSDKASRRRHYRKRHPHLLQSVGKPKKKHEQVDEDIHPMALEILSPIQTDSENMIIENNEHINPSVMDLIDDIELQNQVENLNLNQEILEPQILTSIGINALALPLHTFQDVDDTFQFQTLEIQSGIQNLEELTSHPLQLPFSEADLLRELLEREKAKVGELRTAVTNFTSESTTLTNQLAIIQDNYAILENKHNLLLADYNVVEQNRVRDIEVAERNCRSSFKVEKDELKMNIEKMDNIILAQNDRYSVAEQTITLKEKEKVGILAQIEKLQIHLAENDSIIKSNGEKLEVKEATIDFLNDECREKLLQIEQNNDSIKELNNDLDTSNSKIIQLESSLKKKIAEAERLANDFDEASKTIENKEQDIVAMKSTIKEKEVLIKDIESKYEGIIAKSTADMNTLNDFLIEKQKRCDELTKEIESKKEENVKLLDSVKKAKNYGMQSMIISDDDDEMALVEPPDDSADDDEDPNSENYLLSILIKNPKDKPKYQATYLVYLLQTSVIEYMLRLIKNPPGPSTSTNGTPKADAFSKQIIPNYSSPITGKLMVDEDSVSESYRMIEFREFGEIWKRNGSTENSDPFEYETDDDASGSKYSDVSDSLSDNEGLSNKRNEPSDSVYNDDLDEIIDDETFQRSNTSINANEVNMIDETNDVADLTGDEDEQTTFIEPISIPQEVEAADIVNGVLLTKLGKDNRSKLKITGQYPNGPKSKNCKTCNQSMDWRTTGTLNPRNKSGILSYYSYATAHNGNCVKIAYNAKKMESSKKGEHCLDCLVVDDLILVGSYWFCLEHKLKREEKSKQKLQGVKDGFRCHYSSCHKLFKNGVFIEERGHRYCNQECCSSYKLKAAKYNGSDAQKESFRKSYQNRKNRQRPPDSTTSQVARLSQSLKVELSAVQESLSSDFYIVMDTEMKKGIGHWARNWDHMREVYAIKFEEDEFFELYWSMEYIEASDMKDLKEEWCEFCYGIPYVWYYGSQRCDEIRMEYLLDEGESYEYEWIDAQTKVAMKIMTTDIHEKSKIYVQALGLAFQEDSFIYPGEVSIIGDFLLENSDGLKVINDVQNLLNLILTAQFIVS